MNYQEWIFTIVIAFIVIENFYGFCLVMHKLYGNDKNRKDK